MTHISGRAKLLACGLGLTLLLTACGGAGTEGMISSAKDYLAKNDTKAAVIQLKNALQKNPESGEARFLLGSAFFKAGDVAGAEVELRKAFDLKYSPDSVVPELAKVMLVQGQFKKVIDEFAKSEMATPRGKAELFTARASAYAGLGKADEFQSALASALAAEPDFAPAVIAQARNKAAFRDFDIALAMSDGIIAKDSRNLEAWKLKGDILYFAKNQGTEAIAAYRKTLEIKPDLILGHSSILTILLAQGDLEGAEKQLVELKKVAGNHPQTKFFQAQLAYQKRDFKTARDASQQLLRIAPNNPRAMQLAGAVEFQLNSMLQAEVLLGKALQASPELILARRLLVMTYLRTGQPSKALTTLTQGISKGFVDPEINSVAGEVYLQNGDTKKAEEYFAKAAQQSPKDARKRTSLALTKMISGGADAAFGELENIAASDSGTTADLALISAHLRRSEFDKALKAIDGLEKKQPDKPLAANLRGRTLLTKKDFAGARKSFEKALAIDPVFFPAAASLASLDMQDKKPEDAKKRFESVLAKDPKNGQALLALAELAARTGAPKDQVAALITKAVDINPTEPGPRLLLIEFYMNAKEQKNAMSAAQNAVAAIPESPEVLDALGRVQLVAGEHNQAMATFNKLVGLQPQSPMPFVRLADANMAAKNKDAAAQSLRKALEVKPDMIEAQRGLVMLSLDAKKYSEAVTIAKSVQKQRPKEAIGFVLEGDISAAQKNWDPAVTAYKAGLKEAPASELALKLHSALMASGKTADADKFAAGWVKDSPNDVAFQFYMGDFAIARKDYAQAEKSYSTVVKLQPSNAAAYNNLAWVAGKLNKDTAVGYAEKALQIAPEQPAFMDTLAMLLSDKNDYAKALDWQTKATAAQPQNPLFKLNLAKIHIKGGKKDLAKKELDELVKLGDKFAGQTEVTNLLKSL
jgi:cellulose synthase operon protein C